MTAGGSTLTGPLGAVSLHRDQPVLTSCCESPAATGNAVAKRVRTIRSRLSAQLQAGLPGVGSATIALAARSPDARRLGTLHEVLDLPLAAHERTDQRCLVIFEEFQDLLTLDQELDGVLRSHIQHRLEAASYLFAGSQPSLMTALFGDRHRPLFDQARAVPLGPLPLAPLGDFVADTMERRDRDDLVAHVDALVALSAGHPQRAMLLAYEHFEQPHDAEDPVGDAVAAAVVEAADGLEQTWRALTAAQRRVLGMVADGHRQLLTGPALARTGLGKSSQAAVRNALIAATHLDLDGTTVSFVDPLMPVWIIAGPRT